MIHLPVTQGDEIIQYKNEMQGFMLSELSLII